MTYEIIGAPPCLKMLNKSANYTLVPSDNPVIVVDATAGPVTVTLFNSDEQTPDSQIHRYWVHKIAGAETNPVTVTIDGVETFADGLASFIIYQPGETIQLGGMYHATNPGWMRISRNEVLLQTRRAASWSAGNFSSLTPIPLDTQDQEFNSGVLEWVVTTASRHTAKLGSKLYTFNYGIDINSTGGATWNVLAYVRINGTTEVPGSRRVTGNYGGEDNSLENSCVSTFLDASDYIELVVQQSGLTGSISETLLRSKVTV